MPEIFFEDLEEGAVTTFGSHRVEHEPMVAFAREFSHLQQTLSASGTLFWLKQVCQFLLADMVEGRADPIPDGRGGAFLGAPQQGFEFGKHHLDRD